MPSAITHFLVGGALALPAMESRGLRSVLPRWVIPVSAGLLAVMPDLDTVLARHDPFWGHRGFFHSPFFLLLFCATLAGFVTARHGWRAWGTLAAIWTACAVTHPLLDMLTDGGSGVMLLYPFSEARWFFPWRPIRVSPLSISRFFTRRAGPILRSEAPFDVAAIVAGVVGWRARR